MTHADKLRKIADREEQSHKSKLEPGRNRLAEALRVIADALDDLGNVRL